MERSGGEEALQRLVQEAENEEILRLSRHIVQLEVEPQEQPNE